MTFRPLRPLLIAALACLLMVAVVIRLPAGPLQQDLLNGPVPLATAFVLILLVMHILLQQPAVALWASVALGMVDAPGKDSAGMDARSAVYGRICFWMGLALVVGCLWMLERMQPFYFTQDDNFSQFLPTILHGCRSAEAGVFPNYNPYQLLGAPAAGVGVYALTYLPTYASHLAARFLLGNEYLTMDVFCWLHLVLGYVAMYWTARTAGMRPLLAACAAVCFVLSGYFLIVGRSWYYMTPVALWAPLLAACFIRLMKGPVGWRWTVATGAVIGIFFHAGNAQMWSYALLLFGFAAIGIVWSGAIPLRRSLWLAPALLLGIGIAAPLLVPQLMVTAHIARTGGGGDGIDAGLLAMLCPWIQAPSPIDTANVFPETTGQLYYSGTIFCAAAFLIFCSVSAYRWNRAAVRRNPWVAPGLLAFVLALGDSGLLWNLLSKLPLFSKFDLPFKFLAFFNLFAILMGGVAIERILVRVQRPRLAEIGLGAFVFCIMLFHCAQSRCSFYSFADTPYPRLPAALTRLAASGYRSMSFAPYRSSSHHFVDSLQLNFPTVYGIPSLEGYDPLVLASRENEAALRSFRHRPLAASRAFGMRWLVIHCLMEHAPLSSNPALRELEDDPPFRDELSLLRRHARMVSQNGAVAIWELAGVSPLAFAKESPAAALPVRWSGAGAQVTLKTIKPEQIVVNVLWREGMRATADGRPVRCAADTWGRVVCQAPAGAKVLDVRYESPWLKGWLVGLALCGIAFGMGFCLRQIVRQRTVRTGDQ